MKIRILCVADKLPHWVETAEREYLKRFPPHYHISCQTLPLAKRGKNTKPAEAQQQEAEHIRGALNSSELLIALDVLGETFTSEDLAKKLESFEHNHPKLTFLIGGPDGLAPEILATAQARWSLSTLTLPHALVRILFIEQLYRAWSITQGHPYHK